MDDQTQEKDQEHTWRDDYPEQVERSGGFLELVEDVLLRVALIALVLLVLAQTVMGGDITTIFMSYADRLSFDPMEPQRPVVKDVFGSSEAAQAIISLQLVSHPSAPRLQLIRNGLKASTFEKDQVTLTVEEGDVLELEGTGLNEKYVVRVVLVAGSIAFPPEGKEYVVEDSRTIIGRVR